MLWQQWYSVLEFEARAQNLINKAGFPSVYPQYFSVFHFLFWWKRDCQDDLQQLILKMPFLSLAVNAECNVDWLSLEQISEGSYIQISPFPSLHQH